MKKIATKYLLVLASLAAISCGGGGGGTSNTNSNTVTSSPNSDALFESTPQILTSLKTKYDQLCGNRTNLNAIAVDVNRDGRKDIVLQLYCMHLPAGEAYVGRVVNALAVLVQDQNGTFADQTQAILGSDYLAANGKVQSLMKYDFNGDGYDDVVMTMDGEDNRQPVDQSASNMKFPTVALMSNGNGTYRLESFGANLWGSDLRLIPNSAGSPVLVVLPADNGVQGWTYNNGWVQSSGYGWASTFSSIFLDPTSPETFSNVALNAIKDSAGQYLEVWSRSLSTWTRASSATFLTYQSKTYSDTGNSYKLGRVLNKDFIEPYLYDGCSFKFTSTSQSKPLFAMLGNEIQGGYTVGKVINEPQGASGWGQVNLITMDIDSNQQITNVNSVATVSLDRNYYQLACKDINADGNQDVFIRNLANPIILINDGSGGLKQIKQSSLPSNPVSSRYTYLYEDMDGDGISDIVFIPLGGDSTYDASWSYTGFQMKLHRGLRNSKLSDTN